MKCYSLQPLLFLVVLLGTVHACSAAFRQRSESGCVVGNSHRVVQLREKLATIKKSLQLVHDRIDQVKRDREWHSKLLDTGKFHRGTWACSHSSKFPQLYCPIAQFYVPTNPNPNPGHTTCTVERESCGAID